MSLPSMQDYNLSMPLSIGEILRVVKFVGGRLSTVDSIKNVRRGKYEASCT